LGKSYRFYRLGFNTISIGFFTGIVWYQFSLQQTLLIEQSLSIKIIASFTFMIGVIVLFVAFSAFNKKEFIGFEQLQTTTKETSSSPKKLVKTGFYAYVRHPLYFGVILMLIGALLFLPNLSMLIFIIASFSYLPIGVMLEEQKLIAEFGEQYVQYQREVKMLFPFVF
jgi:protein-S-isoprenylcysteine O-methyltransferase Ste14